MKMNFAKTRFYLSTRFRLILLAGSALTLILFGPGVAVAAVVAVSDFNGDGHPDFVLQGGAGGQQTGIWYMNNNVFVGALFGPTLPVGWSLRIVGPSSALGSGVRDFNGDGHPDYVLQGGAGLQQTGIWYMNNNDFVGALFGPTLPGLMWAVVGTGDFNGDGHPDYVVENIFTGQTGIWYMNNNVFVGALSGPTLPVGWFVVAVGDFNGDGHPDFVLEETPILGGPSTRTGIWYMDNNEFVGALFGPTLPVGWVVRAVGDFNGDGHPDFVLQGGLGGQQTGIWYLNNNVFVGALSGPTLPVGWVN